MIGKNKENGKIEKQLLKDEKLLENFIKLSELSVQNSPIGFTDSVMTKINSLSEIENIQSFVSIPALSRKLCATVCFCSAALILISTITGFNSQICEFILNSSDKLNETLNIFF